MTMINLYAIALYLFPWAILVISILLARVLFKWAKAQKIGAYVFGSFAQMFLPDPYAERTIKVVQENKQQVKKQKENQGEPVDETTYIVP